MVPVKITEINFFVSGPVGYKSDPAVENPPIPGQAVDHLAAKTANHPSLVFKPAFVALSNNQPSLKGIEQTKLHLHCFALDTDQPCYKELCTDGRPVLKIDFS